jgi:DNA repair exonuclease SbcCD ATPase subunit
MEEELLQSRLQVEYLTSCVSQLNQVVEDLEEDKDELIEDNRRLRDNLEDLEDDYDDLRDDYLETMGGLRKLEDDYEDLRDEFLEVKETLTNDGYDFDVMRDKCRKDKKALAKLENEYNDMCDKYREVNETLTELEADYDILRDEFIEVREDRSRSRDESNAFRVALSEQQLLDEATERRLKLAQIDDESEAMDLDPLPEQTVAVAHLSAEYWTLSEQLARANSLAALKVPPQWANQLIVIRGNAAAHNRDCLADQSLFNLGYMGSSGKTSLFSFTGVRWKDHQKQEDHDENLFKARYNNYEDIKENAQLFRKMYGCDPDEDLPPDKAYQANRHIGMSLA